MPRRIANDARNPLRRPVSIDVGYEHRRLGCIQPNAGMIVLKDEYAGVLGIDRATNARITWTEIAVFHVGRSRPVLMSHRFSIPGTSLPVGGNNYPFFT